MSCAMIVQPSPPPWLLYAPLARTGLILASPVRSVLGLTVVPHLSVHSTVLRALHFPCSSPSDMQKPEIDHLHLVQMPRRIFCGGFGFVCFADFPPFRPNSLAASTASVLDRRSFIWPGRTYLVHRAPIWPSGLTGPVIYYIWQHYDGSGEMIARSRGVYVHARIPHVLYAGLLPPLVSPLIEGSGRNQQVPCPGVLLTLV
ncbi:hypothetical protein C8R46DRAFT_275467 [Mycena filopes]|nr:hypothetical protein C8R46DRAFT_275467 [Mycena filopes]